MPASVILTGLSWSTPDAEPLFSQLDLSFAREKTGLIGRNGVGKSTLLQLISGELKPHQGLVHVEGCIGVLPQLTDVPPDLSLADAFGVTRQWEALQRIEKGEATEADFATADWTLEARLLNALNLMELGLPPETRLVHLSGGQRTRVLLAALMFAQPDVVLMDEPGNHLDRQGRQALKEWLETHKGTVIMASHDRDLLEAMQSIVELTGKGAQVFGGNWSHYRERKALELAAQRHTLNGAQKEIDLIKQKVQTTRERKVRKDSAGERKRVRNDMPRILMNSLRSHSENTGGANDRLAHKQLESAQKTLQAARERIEILEPVRIDMPSTGLPAGREVVRAENLSGGYDPQTPLFADLSFTLTGPERVAIEGPNGTGKSTLLRLLNETLTPFAGTLRVNHERMWLDQDAGVLEPSDTLRDNFRRLNPQSDENQCRQALARFRFRADAALKTVARLSGGEKMRAALACVLGIRPPELLLLDEPDNHLDLEALSAVEAGLKAYDGALIVISHDEAFLQAIGIERRIRLPIRGD